MRKSYKELEFRQMYEQYWQIVYAYVYNIIAEQEHSEDIVQEIFINLWNRFDQVEIKEPKAYLLQAARFQCAKHFRKHKFNHLQLESVVDVLKTSEQDYSIQEAEELLQEISNKATSLLPDKCRQVFELRFKHQLTNKEIAEELGLSVSTVENQINKALNVLRLSFSQQASVLVVLAVLFQ